MFAAVDVGKPSATENLPPFPPPPGMQKLHAAVPADARISLIGLPRTTGSFESQVPCRGPHVSLWGRPTWVPCWEIPIPRANLSRP